MKTPSLRLSNLATLLACSTALAELGVAQQYISPDVARGPASAWPACAVIENAPTLTGIRLKLAGDQVSKQGVLTPPGALDPGAQTAGPSSLTYPFLATFFSGALADIEIDAMSSGNGVIPSNVAGVPTITEAWLGIAVSIADGENGAVGSHYRAAVNASLSAGSEISAYYFEQSDGIDDSLIGSTTLETSRAQFGLPNGGEDITAFDYGMGVFTTVAPDAASVFFNEGDESFYFSVSSAWAIANSSLTDFAESYLDPTVTVAPHGADIYRLRWAGSAGWIGPYVWTRAEDLGLNRLSSDVDALDVDESEMNVVYSATSTSHFVKASTGDVGQIMVVEMAPHPGFSNDLRAERAPMAVANAAHDGSAPVQRVGVRVGIVNGGSGTEEEVDAVCTFDPEATLGGRLLGVPVASLEGATDPMGISMVCVKHGVQAETTWLVQVTGWGDHFPERTGLTLFRHNTPVFMSTQFSEANFIAITDPKLRTQNRATTEFTIELPASFFNQNHGFLGKLHDAQGTVLATSYISLVRPQ